MNINGHIMDEQYWNTNGCTVLHCAAKHIDVVKYLINECNCNIMSHGKNGVPFLHYVASEGLLDVLKQMIMNINGHIMDEQYWDTNGRTVLHCAAKHIDVVKYLINECKCGIMITDKDANTILHAAASKGSLNVIKYLINTCHYNPMTTNKNGETVLHLAIKHIDVVKYLIKECNCNIMETDEDGWTSLHLAAWLGTLEVIEYLLFTRKCDPLAKDKKGRTPLELAKRRRHNTGTVIAIFKKFGDIKISHPIDSYVNVLLVGNPGAGKSTLIVTSSRTQLVLLFLVPLEMLEG
ncbi:PREDICTED: espin-like [Amphimedon queenslandica]|uniref:Uncharacterized protein n=1 Tax=Amphimedon queenslandica TaxID=400682 RepID=A0AAN0IYH6_AMPQE|nr:PREDICTED: espin-like [Amphimedon queenslandica]|eukprot:XP_019849602.1 PREDICTED: espin-like [Amphimedon queenslandica]